MKKFGFIAAVVVLGAGVAFANSLSVPCFVDGGGTNGYIALHNNLDTELMFGVIYFSGEGEQLEFDPLEVSNNTAVIPANATVSYRPVSQVGESALANTIPGRPVWSGASSIPTAATNWNGAAVISWSQGDGQSLQGRYQELNTNNNSMMGFLLPPGG